MTPDPVVSTQWLADHLSAPDVRVLDASWFLPGSDRDPRTEYEQVHVPGAQFFDIDDICDTDSPLPHMLPSPIKFASRVRKMGLGDGARLVIYDSQGMFSAPRVWWMFRAMGHEETFVLDGGLPKWISEGRPTQDMPVRPQERHFTPRLNYDLLRDLHQMKANQASGREQVVDARPEGRFAGSAPEPRAGLASGHMPGAINLPWSKMIAPDGTLLPADALRQVFSDSGLDLDKPIITTCGSGVTAAILSLGLARIGRPRSGLYDGAWAEWASQPDAPIATGPA